MLPIFQIIPVLLFLLLIFLLIRALVLWYFKINIVLIELEEQNKHLKHIAAVLYQQLDLMKEKANPEAKEV